MKIVIALFWILFGFSLSNCAVAEISTRMRIATYNVLSDHYKNPAWEHVRNLAAWGDCSSGTRCALAKSLIERAAVDIIALQEIPKAAYDALVGAMPDFAGMHFSSTTEIRGKKQIDGVAILWRTSAFDRGADTPVGFNTTEHAYATPTDKKPAGILTLIPKATPGMSVAVASSHFGDSIYQNDDLLSGRTKMAAILSELDKLSSADNCQLNMILGDFNQDQYFKPGFQIDAPGKGSVAYDEVRDKIKPAYEAGYMNGAKTDNGDVDHALSLSWTSPQFQYELDAPHQNLTTKKLGPDRFIDWGLFKATKCGKMKVTRVHGDFNQFEMTYDNSHVPNITKGADVLRASDHLMVVFDVSLR